MQKFLLLFLCFGSFGCNYSLSKISAAQRGTGGSGSIEALPPGTLVGYQVIATSIMQPKCLECHSGAGGDAGGINLETYENVAANLGIIKSEVQSNSMPKNRPVLTAKEKEILFTWIDNGGPRTTTSTPTPPTPPLPPTPPTPPAPPVEPPVPPTEPDVQFITYEMVNTQVLAPRCIGCHSAEGGKRGDVNLETYENVVGSISDIEEAIESGSMPRPRNRPLTPEQKKLILTWISRGAPRTK
jgi:uncharacterized membrane protein